MLTFDEVPVMDREYFEQCLRQATSFAVWVQVNPALQRLVQISREDAIDIAYDGLRIMPIWGQLSSEGCLELSLTSQWLEHLDDEKTRREALAILDKMRADRDQGLCGDQDRRPCEVLPGS